MKNTGLLFLVFVSILSFSKSYGQDELQNPSTSYSNLKRVKVFAYVPDSLENEKIKTDREKKTNKRTTYSVNESRVSKEYFEKNYKKLVDKCYPCILEKYSADGKLESEKIVIIDGNEYWAFERCVGWFRYYYPNGQVKYAGQYTENLRGNEFNRWSSYIPKPKGTWLDFDEGGNIIKSETFDNEDVVELEELPLVNKDFYLINSLDTNKIVKLKATWFNEPVLNYNANISDTSIMSAEITLKGYLIDLKNDSLVFKANNKDTYIIQKNGVVFKNEECYNCGLYVGAIEVKDSLRIQKINLENLNYLSYLSPTRQTVSNSGTLLSTLSAITTLFVAPLVSINYKNGNFNKDRYYKLAGGGLVGFTVGLPFALLNSKTYNLSSENGQKSKKHWFLKLKTQ